MNQVEEYQQAIAAHLEQLNDYIEGGMSNASLARRIRKASTELAKQGKDVRKLTIEHHTK